MQDSGRREGKGVWLKRDLGKLIPCGALSTLVSPGKEHVLSCCWVPGTVLNATQALFLLSLDRSVQQTLLLVPVHLWSISLNGFNVPTGSHREVMEQHSKPGLLASVIRIHSILINSATLWVLTKPAIWISLRFSVCGGQSTRWQHCMPTDGRNGCS